MEVPADGRRQRLVLSFVVGAVVALLLTGLGVTVFTVRSVTRRAEGVAAFAQFVTDAVLAPALDGIPLDHPLSGPALERLDAVSAIAS